MGLPAIFSGIGAAGSLINAFGGGGNTGAQQQTLGNINGIAGNINGQAQTQLNALPGLSGTANAANNNYANYLSQDPWTSGNNAAYLANMTNGMTGAYNQARSQLTQNLASRGLTGPSSANAGAQTGLLSSELGTLGRAQNNLANQQVASTGQRLGTLENFDQGLQTQGYNRAMGGLGQALGAYQTTYGDQSQLAQQQQNQQNQNAAGVGGAFSTLGNVLGRGGGYPGASSTDWASQGIYPGTQYGAPAGPSAFSGPYSPAGSGQNYTGG